ncbi:DUF7548 family protein [Halobaculum sp. D14]|uniref:DUF7548 family protein n=1 Tax=Halobaculum sp. D14 TaxID=3421642 RepID=UPI003EB6C8C8
MDRVDAALTAGMVGCLAVLAALAAPFALISEPGTGLGVYYASGPVGVGAVVFLAVLLLVVFLSGRQSHTDDVMVAGVAVVAAVALLAAAAGWALAVDQQNLFSFPASAQWITMHRWVVVALAATVPVSAAAYASEAL